MRIARFGEPDEIASAVAFLASPQPSYIHGAILDADGGQTRTLVSPASTTPGGMPGAPIAHLAVFAQEKSATSA